jgi:hypothetical protein
MKSNQHRDFYSTFQGDAMKPTPPAAHQDRLETFARELARILRRIKKQLKRQPPVEKKPVGDSKPQ